MSTLEERLEEWDRSCREYWQERGGVPSDVWGEEDNYCRGCGGDCPPGEILCYECQRS